MNAVKTLIKKVQTAVADKKLEEAKALLREAISAVGKAASKGVLKRNTASRRISRLTLRVNALSNSLS
jgi:small subunit ribosomal protein S20